MLPRPLVMLLFLTAVAFAGCVGDDAPADDGGAPTEDGGTAPVLEPKRHVFEGEFVLGGVDEPHTYSFDVPDNATEVAALLTWSIPGAVLDFSLVDPAGAENGNGWGESDSHRYVTSPYPVRSGEWTVTVTADQGADVHYQLTIEARIGAPWGPIQETYTILPNDFAEINLNMEPGDSFDYEWSSDADVYFNIHFHDDGETNRSVETTASELEGRFDAPATEVYSLLWRNQGTMPVEVIAQVDGSYRLHSMTRDAPDDP